MPCSSQSQKEMVEMVLATSTLTLYSGQSKLVTARSSCNSDTQGEGKLELESGEETTAMTATCGQMT